MSGLSKELSPTRNDLLNQMRAKKKMAPAQTTAFQSQKQQVESRSESDEGDIELGDSEEENLETAFNGQKISYIENTNTKNNRFNTY